MLFKEENTLVTGGGGYLGSFLKKVMPLAKYPSRQELELKNFDSISTYFKKNRIDTVIHLGAVASIPECEKNKNEAYDINVNGTRRILTVAQESGIKHFLYLSTACVFSGEEENYFYSEEDIPYPKHFYGLTKYIAEEIAKTFNSEKFKVTIVRTNFGRFPWPYQKAFTDRCGTYLFAEDVATELKEIASKKPAPLIIHLCGNKKLSMYEYALLGGSKVEPLTMKEYRGVPLTKNMCLTSKYWKICSIKKLF
jgi:dTDP-4-dehydrorhamnose reductase